MATDKSGAATAAAKTAKQTAAKTVAKSAAKTAAKTATKTATKTAGKTAVKTASRTAAKTAGKAAAKSAAPAAPFAGFSKATLAFYKGVAANNNLEWFSEHRDGYIANVITPAQALVNELGPRLQKISPGIGFHPDFNGKGSIKKIQTDRRFNPDRTPYKTWLDIMFWEGPAPVKKENPAFYIRLTEKTLGVACGAMYFEKNMIKAWREAVLDKKLGPELDSIVKKLTGGQSASAKNAPAKSASGGGYKIYAESLKQLPRGVDATHPLADYTKYESFCLVREAPHPKELFSAGFIPWCEASFRELLPLHQWLLKVYSKAYV